ncbi:hypothetical protein H5410_056942 [Solanum commersonii]|uniref:Uncharacterized protein n=1 Tax=Solanum commersonii TaxID=4109 RepID=A0A9J5WP62_SOLCO|nr:hypothetical protein H5410_056942 [Solanum commersonii]
MEETEKELGDRQNGRANRTVSEEKETQMGNQREVDGNKEEFQVQRNKKHQGKGRQQVWNPKQPHKGVEEKMTTENKFEALEDSEQKEAEEKRSKEIISTRKWVENAFNKPNREDGQRDTVEREKEIMHETNQEQKDMPPGDMGEGSALTVWEPICETDNAQKKVLSHPISIIEPNSQEALVEDMNALTPDQKRRCREEEEDEDLEMNILSAGKVGDLSPRQIADLNVASKREERDSQLYLYKSKRGEVGRGRIQFLNDRTTIILEYQIYPGEIEQYKRRLGFDRVAVNSSAKLWDFWKDHWEGQVIVDSYQQITVRFCYQSKFFSITSVYARCNAMERLELWEDI